MQLGNAMLRVVCVVAMVFGSWVGRAQQHVNTDEQINSALGHLNVNKTTGYDLEVLREAHYKGALPSLESSFSGLTDTLLKMKAAALIVELGSGDSQYWDYLTSKADEAVKCDAPEPVNVRPDGKVDSANGVSKSFIVWSQQHSMSAQTGLELVGMLYPAALSFLADTHDPRAIALLKRGLASSVYMIQLQAARGLAELHDEDSADVIIALSKGSPPEIGKALAADALVFFDNPRAQKVVDDDLDKDYAKALREARKNGRTALH